MRYADVIECVPEPCQVLGTPLRPFSLGHHLLFKRLALPFERGPLEECSRDDLIMGVAVCAAPYSETLAEILDGSYARTVEAWMRGVRGPWWRRRRVDWPEAETLFRLHLARGYRKPPVWRHRTEGGLAITAPEECLLKGVLVRNGFSESEVLEGYLPARWYDYWTVTELEKAERCSDAKRWTRTFYTSEDAEAMASIRKN